MANTDVGNRNYGWHEPSIICKILYWIELSPVPFFRRFFHAFYQRLFQIVEKWSLRIANTHVAEAAGYVLIEFYVEDRLQILDKLCHGNITEHLSAIACED